MVLPILFFIFATLAVLGALAVILTPNPVRAVLFLVLTFFATGAIWLMAQAEFLALVLILVYVGAVMTLFLFVVMMMNIDAAERKSYFVKRIPIAVGILVLLAFFATRVVDRQIQFAAAGTPHQLSATSSNTKMIGSILYTDYFYAFEVAGAILLVAIIAAIALAHRGTRASKTQSPDAQIQVRSEERIRLVKMSAEKRE